MARVFVSAAAADENFAQRLCDCLRGEGVECLPWPQSGSEGAAQCGEAASAESADALILVLTPEFLESSSEAYRKSVQSAAESGMTVIALQPRDVPLPIPWRAFQPVEVFGDSGVEKACFHVLEILTAAGGSAPGGEKTDTASEDSPEAVAPEEPTSPPPESLRDRWKAWLGVAATVAALVAFVLTLPTMIGDFKKNAPTILEKSSQPLAGVVWDEQQEPLAGVAVSLPEFNLQATTKQDGRFSFQVPESRSRPVEVIFRKDGYATRKENPFLPNPSFSFVMRKKP